MTAKPLSTLLTEIATNFPDNVTGLILPGTDRTTLSDITASGRTALNVMDYGATGNGVTDDSANINNALSALAAQGGGTLFFPPGTYLMSTSTLIPPSNSVIQGAGIDATTILNTATASIQDCALSVIMTMTSGANPGIWTGSNTTYPINAPTLGANTVTTTTAANAGNFHAGDIIMISGGFGTTAFWFPSWYTTVVSANAGSGVITLAETLPFGGSTITTVQKIVSLPKNIRVRDLTLSVNSTFAGSPPTSGSILEVLGCENFWIENCKFVNVSGNAGAAVAIGAPCRRSGARACYAGPVAGPLELFGCSESSIVDCSLFHSGILVDGGSMDCFVGGNHVKDPQENGANFFGIYVPATTLRVRVIGNMVTGIPSDATFGIGIACVDTPDAQRDHLIMGNTCVGVSTTNTIGINTSKGIVANNVLVNLSQGIILESVSDTVIADNYFDNVTLPAATFGGTGLYRTRTNPTLQSMANGVASPTVQGGQSYTLNQGGVATNVSGFTGGLNGDEITVIVTDGAANGTTFKNVATLQLKGNVDYNPAGSVIPVVMCFVKTGSTVWTEKSRSA